MYICMFTGPGSVYLQVIVKKLYSRDLRARRRNWRLKRLADDLSERTSLRSASDNPYAFTFARICTIHQYCTLNTVQRYTFTPVKLHL